MGSYPSCSRRLGRRLKKTRKNWQPPGIQVGNLPTIGLYINVLTLTIDISLAAHGFQVSYSIPMYLPFRRNDNFTGRERELAEIHKILLDYSHSLVAFVLRL